MHRCRAFLGKESRQIVSNEMPTEEAVKDKKKRFVNRGVVNASRSQNAIAHCDTPDRAEVHIRGNRFTMAG